MLYMLYLQMKQLFEAIIMIMDEFNLVDIWRSEHPNLRKYTRHQKHPVVLSRSDCIFASNNLVHNVKFPNIISGVSSSVDVPVRGKGYWKLKLSLF